MPSLKALLFNLSVDLHTSVCDDQQLRHTLYTLQESRDLAHTAYMRKNTNVSVFLAYDAVNKIRIRMANSFPYLNVINFQEHYLEKI